MFQTTPQLISAYPDWSTVSVIFQIMLQIVLQNFRRNSQNLQMSQYSQYLFRKYRLQSKNNLDFLMLRVFYIRSNHNFCFFGVKHFSHFYTLSFGWSGIYWLNQGFVTFNWNFMHVFSRKPMFVKRCQDRIFFVTVVKTQSMA